MFAKSTVQIAQIPWTTDKHLIDQMCIVQLCWYLMDH